MTRSYADNALGTAAAPRPAGGASLTLQAGDGAAFAAGSPTVGSPMPVALFRPSATPGAEPTLLGAVLVSAVSGDVLTVAGPVPGMTDPAVQIGDIAACVPLAADMAALWTAIAAVPAGAKGDQGDPGATGPKGDQGDPGTPGATGPKGDQGDPGPAGTAGPKGDQGDPGPAGTAGPKGDQGDPGPAGTAGPKGDQGDPGPAGTTGATGPAGPQRARYVWTTLIDAAAATGDASEGIPAPFACVPTAMRIWAGANPTGVCTANVKAGGTGILSSGVSTASGSTAVVEVTSGWAVASIAKGTMLVANYSALPSDARGVKVEIALEAS